MREVKRTQYYRETSIGITIIIFFLLLLATLLIQIFYYSQLYYNEHNNIAHVSRYMEAIPSLIETIMKEESPHIKNNQPMICQLYYHDMSTNNNKHEDKEEYKRIVAIGDVHGAHEGLKEILFHANITSSIETCQWRTQIIPVLLIQTGDIVDRGPGTTESWECLQSLQTTAPMYSRVVRLLGNHELLWLQGDFRYINKRKDTSIRIKQLVQQMKNAILSGRVVASFSIKINNIPFLFSHAGIRPSFYTYLHKIIRTNQTNILSSDDISSYMNTELISTVRKCSPIADQHCKFHEELYQAGRDRGDSKHIGGPFWSDFSVMISADTVQSSSLPSMIQVVGHSISPCCEAYIPSSHHLKHHDASCFDGNDGLIRSTQHISAVCIDGGMFMGTRSYLELSLLVDDITRSSRSKLFAHEKRADGVWSTRVLGSELCA